MFVNTHHKGEGLGLYKVTGGGTIVLLSGSTCLLQSTWTTGFLGSVKTQKAQPPCAVPHACTEASH